MEAQAINLGVETIFNTEKAFALTQQNAAMPELIDLQVQFMQAEDGFANKPLIDRTMALARKYPKMFVGGAPGSDLLTQIMAVPMLEQKFSKTLEFANRVPPGTSFNVAGVGMFNRDPERAVATGPASTIGKEISDYNNAVAMGDTEAAQMLKAAIMARGQKDGMAFKFDENGRISEITQGPQGSGGSKPSTAIVSDAEKVANSAANLVNFGSDIIALAQDGNVGISGNLKRTYKELAGQFIDVDAGDEFDFSQAVTFFKGSATKILRSDSQITEEERRAIISDLPSKGFLESPATAKQKAKTAIRRVAESARRQIKRAGVPMPFELMTVEDMEEIDKQFREGKITREQAKQAAQRKGVF